MCESTVQLSGGGLVVFYTGGLTEAPARDGRFLAEGELFEALRGWRDLTASAIADRVEGLAVTFQNGAVRDDLALVVLNVAPTGT